MTFKEKNREERALKENFIKFSKAGIRVHDNRDLLLVGVGCWQWSWPIVKTVVNEWLAEGKGLDHLRDVNWNLGMVVGAVVSNHTRDDFKWPIVTQIIETSGKQKMTEGIIASFSTQYPLGVSKFTYGPGGRNVKCVAQEMAKAILWIEALTFLDNEGFGKKLKK